MRSSRSSGRGGKTLLGLGLFALTGMSAAWGATYYVDASTKGCGGLPCSDANTGLTEAQAFATPAGCISHMNGGDTCLVKPGTYAGEGANAFSFCGTTTRNLSGTDASHYTVFKAFNATKPKLCRNSTCSDSGNYDPNVILGQYNRATNTNLGHPCQYIRFEGFEVHGNLSVEGNGTAPTHHITVTGNDISGAGENDGNTNVMWLQDEPRAGGNVHHIQIDHNLFHDVWSVDTYGGQYSLIKNFGASYLTIEYNMFDVHGCSSGGTPCQATSVAAFDDKDCPYNNTLRFNYARGGTNGNYIIRIANQCNGSSEGWNQVYGNVAENVGVQFAVAQSFDGPWQVHHNTFINPGQGNNNGLLLGLSGAGFNEVTFRDNIVTGKGGAGSNVLIQSASWGAMASNVIDYNRYDSTGSWRGAAFGTGDTTYSTIATWRSGIQSAGCPGCEAHSSAGSVACPSCVSASLGTTAPCTFLTGTDTPFHIAATDTTCKTMSSTGGEVGAYGAPGATGCVGNTCGAPSGPVCGNGIVETGEVCDDGNTVSETVCPYGQRTCTACNAACSATLNLTGPYCGDGIVNGGESCDGAQLGGASCTSLGYTSGTLSCLSTCSYDLSNCQGGASANECTNPSPDWLLCDGFESGTLSYWSDDLNTDSGRLGTTATGAHSGTYAAQEAYAAGTPGDGWGAKFFADHPLLANPGAPVNELYLRWWSKFSTGYSFPSISVKSWIVASFESWTANYPGPNSWSPFYVILETDQSGLSTITIHRKVPADQWQSLAQNMGTPIAPSTGTWHEMQVHLKLNTPGAADGVAEMWIDGAQKSSYTGVDFRGTYSAHGWNDLLLSAYANASSPVNQNQWWDNLVVSRTFIASSNTDITPPSAPTSLRRSDSH